MPERPDSKMTQYKLVGSIKLPDGGFLDIESDWHISRSKATSAMQALQDQGHNAEVHTRELHTTVNSDEVPRS